MPLRAPLLACACIALAWALPSSRRPLHNKQRRLSEHTLSRRPLHHKHLHNKRRRLSEHTPSGGPVAPACAVPGRHYVFVTHHKTGTNLMNSMCNWMPSAMGVDDDCSWCGYIFKNETGSGLLCSDVHGVLKPQPLSSKFVLVSSIDGEKMEELIQSGLDFRAVHMIREPVDMIISSYNYDMNIETNKRGLLWDVMVPKLRRMGGIHEQLRAEAFAMLSTIREMVDSNNHSVADPRFLTLDLHTFGEDYDGTTARMFSFLFEGIPEQDLDELVRAAAMFDTSRWSEEELDQNVGTTAADGVNRTAAKEAWREMEAAGDPDFLEIASYAKLLGYPPSVKLQG